jgi:hypothetical protein
MGTDQQAPVEAMEVLSAGARLMITRQRVEAIELLSAGTWLSLAAQPGRLIDFGNGPELPNSVPSFLTVFGGAENPSSFLSSENPVRPDKLFENGCNTHVTRPAVTMVIGCFN